MEANNDSAIAFELAAERAQLEAALASEAEIREVLSQWTESCIEEGDLRLLMASLSGRALDESDINFSARYGAGLAAAREALATPPSAALERLKADAGRERAIAACKDLEALFNHWCAKNGIGDEAHAYCAGAANACRAKADEIAKEGK